MGLDGLSYPNESHLKKKKNGRFPYDPTILYDSTRSYVRSYHFYDPNAILIVLVRWDHKIVRFYDPDRDFDNYDHNKHMFD